MTRTLSLVAALTVAFAAAARAQVASESYTFLMMIGKDTVASEVVQRSALRMDVDMIEKLAGGRLHFGLSLTTDGRVARMSDAFYRLSPPDSLPSQNADFEFLDDSVHVHLLAPAAHPQVVASSPNALPYVNPSFALIEQAIVRARAIEATGAPVTVPLFVLAGGRTVPAVVTWLGTDSATLSIGAAVMRAAITPDGHLLGLAVPSQKLRVIRVDGLHPVRVAAHDYGPPAGAPYTAQEVTVHTKEGFTLAGTLTLPKVSAGQKVGAIVTITGSGPQDRDESTPVLNGWRPFWQLADTLARRGIAVLRMDDRGVGGSEAGPPGATSADFANDIRAALAYLRTRPEIDGARLGLVGHSEGGMIAPMIAATDNTLKGIVLMAGPAWTGRRVSDSQVREAIERTPSIAPSQRDAAFAANDVQREKSVAANAWLRFFFDYDPIPTARRVRVPVLILQGERDTQVNPQQAGELATAFRAANNRDVTVRMFPNTNHLFVADSSGHPDGYESLPSLAVRPEVLGAIADWLAVRLR